MKAPLLSRFLACLIPALLFTACGDAAPEADEGPRLPPERRVAERYAASLEVDLTRMERLWSGLYRQDLRVGEGPRADSGDVVTVRFTGWLPGGREFDSNVDRPNPLEVALGYGRVIDGWDQGLVGMREGGRRRLVVPPLLGYGDTRRGSIPPNSTLVFDVEVVGIENRTPEAETGQPR